jgi:hypothetical protein
MAGVGGGGQALPEAVEGLREGGEPGVDVAPRLLALGVHQVEGGAHVVQGARDHREVRLRHVGVVHLDLEAEPLEERLLRHLLALVGRLCVERGRMGSPGELLARRVALGGEVGQPVLVSGDAEVGRGHRVERAVVVDVGVGDRVDGAGAGGVVAHGQPPYARPGPLASSW